MNNQGEKNKHIGSSFNQFLDDNFITEREMKEAMAAQKLAAEKRKETAITSLIMACIIATAFLLAVIGVNIGYTLDYDTIANLFFSSMLILAAIVIIENTSKLVLTASVFSGVFVATGLYLIWSVS